MYLSIPELLENAAAMASIAGRSPWVAKCLSEKRARKRRARLSLESSQRTLRSSGMGSGLASVTVIVGIVPYLW